MNSLLRSRRNRLAAALLSGVMLVKVVNLTPWWLLAWIAPVPLLLAVFHAPATEARLLSLLSPLIGLAGNFGYYKDTANSALAAIVILLLQALGWAAIVLIARGIVLRSRLWLTVFAYPLLWAALDTLVAALSPHASFGSLAYSQMDVLRVIQIASLFGTPGIVFVISLAASTIAVFMFRGSTIRMELLAYGLPGIIIAAALLFGGWRLAQPRETQRVAAGLAAIDDYIGPPIPTARVAQVWQTYEDAIVHMAAHGARLILLPEKIEVLSAKPTEQRIIGLLAAAARSSGVYLAAGTGYQQDHLLRNRAWLFSPEGELLTTYDKQHLVPGLESEFTPGRSFVTQTIAGVRYGLAICKDMHFASLGRGYGRLGVDAMLIPAWDFERDAWMAARITALRGVESGFTVIRASREGLLTVSDRFGRIIAEKPSGALPGGALLVNAPVGHAVLTLYAHIGDVFGWSCVALAFAIRFLWPGLKPSDNEMP